MGTDDLAVQQRRDRNRWWLWCAGGFVLSLGLLLVLGRWFPVSAGVLGGWFVVAFSMRAIPSGRHFSANSASTIGAFVLTVIGLGLLIGVVWPSRGEADPRIEGIVLGAVLTAVGLTWMIVVEKRFSARRVEG